ncbi:MAG: hypothetical protein LIO62_00490 [Clostridiales bacterium]|nr:hypothetical protein [Clostridiales bacterium]
MNDIEYELNFSLTRKDYISFEVMKFRQQRTGIIAFTFCCVILAVGIHYAISQDDYIYLISTAVMLAAVIFEMIYLSKVRPKRRVDKLLSNDETYTSPVRMKISPDFVELESVPKENEPMVIGVYPFGVINAIFETSEYYYLYLTAEVKILPKNIIPKEIDENIKKILRSKAQYAKLKNI